MSLHCVLVLAAQFGAAESVPWPTGGGFAALVIGLPILALIALIVVYVRTRLAIRRHELEPPLHLLRYITGSDDGESSAPPPTGVDPEDDETDRARRRATERLRRRGRLQLAAAGGAGVLVWMSSAWYLRSFHEESSDPAAPVFAVVQHAPAAAASATEPERRPGEVAESTLALPMEASTLSADAPSTGAPERRPEPPASTRPAVSPRPVRASPIAPDSSSRSPAEAAGAAEDSVRQPPVVEAPLAPRRNPDPAYSEPRPPERDPALERTRAEEALTAGVQHVVTEINSRSGPALALADAAAIRRLAAWVRANQPAATAGAPENVMIDGSRGEAMVALTLRWRDDFGVSKQRVVRLRIGVQRESDDWLYTGAQLLEKFP